MPRIRFAARDPGGANVLVPLIQRLSSACTTDIWALPVAAAVFERNACPARIFDDPPQAALLVNAWKADPADLLITGTSGYAPFESVLWRVACDEGIPTLAVIDAWINTPVRFRDGRPAYVGALDSGQKVELQRLGFESERVIVVGHAWLDQFRRRSAAVVQGGAAEPRSATVQLLFVSEGFAQDIAKGVNVDAGFDELDSFRLLWRAAAAAASADRTIELAVKFHPYEDPARFLGMLAGLPARPHLKVRALPIASAPWPWVLWADLVAGVTTMLLLESIVLERPVVSIQPGSRGEDAFVASARGCATTVRTEADLDDLVALIRDPSRRRDALDSNRRFLDGLPGNPEEILGRWIERQLEAVR